MKSFLQKFNWLSLVATLLLIAVGTMAIRSAGCAREEAVFHGLWISNLITALVGLGLYLFLSAVDYRRLLTLGALPAYAVSVVLLVVVLFVGTEQFGGRRWLWFFQPSEVSKLGVIALVAWLFGGGHPRLDAWRPKFRGFLLAAVVLGVPALLILAEPDLGTALTLVPAVLVMLLAAGVWRRGLLTLIALAALGALMLLGAVYEAERPGVPAERRARILACVPLKDHQLKRVRVFLFPEQDRLGAGYNLRQSLMAIGSGGFVGKGLGKGEANHLKYLPQAISMNDFIFCVYAEEMGFVGALVLLGLFGIVLLCGCRTALIASDGSGRLLALGITMLVFAHVYVNIAMSVGLVPITGLPLPFISSGRTFLIVVLCGLGFIQSINIHREENTK